MLYPVRIACYLDVFDVLFISSRVRYIVECIFTMAVAISARASLLVFLHLVFIIHKSQQVQFFADAETIRNEHFVSSNLFMCLTNFVVPITPCHGVTL